MSSVVRSADPRAITSTAPSQSHSNSAHEEILQPPVTLCPSKEKRRLDQLTEVKETGVLSDERADERNSQGEENRKENYMTTKGTQTEEQHVMKERLVKRIRELRKGTGSIREKCCLTQGGVQVEREMMETIEKSGAPNWIELMIKLWGMPVSISRLSLIVSRIKCDVEGVYNKCILGKRLEDRLWWLLRDTESKKVKKEIIEKVVKIALSRSGKAVYMESLDIAAEVVLYCVNTEGTVRNFTIRDFRRAKLCQGLLAFEADGTCQFALALLETGRFVDLVYMVSYVTKKRRESIQLNEVLSAYAMNHFFVYFELLTPRAASVLMARHCTGPGGAFLVRDFIRMYMAITDCGSSVALRYWFAVLDHDGDGIISRADIAYYFANRRDLTEHRSGAVFTDASNVWFKLCAATRVYLHEEGIRLKNLQELNANDREFVLCVLLSRTLQKEKIQYIINIKKTNERMMAIMRA